MSTFGERLRQLRIAAGLSQAEVAGEDLSASYVSLLEAGKRTPSDEVVQQLAVRLGCSPSQLLDGRPSERDERISLELAFARLAVEHGEAPEARRRLERLLEEEGLPPRIRDEISHQLAVACDRCGDLRSAIKIFFLLFQRAVQQQTHLPVHMLGVSLCGCYLDAGDIAQAITIGEQGLEAARARGLGGTDEFYRLAATVMNAYLERGDYAHARAWAEDLLERTQVEDRRSGQAALYWNLGVLAETEGRIRDALGLYEHALGRLSELENSRDFARLRAVLAMGLLQDDPPQYERSLELLRRCHDDLRDLGSRPELAGWNSATAVALLHAGGLAEAELRARQALDLARDNPVFRAEAMQALSDILAAQGRDDVAAETLREAQSAMREAPMVRSAALSWRELGERLAEADLPAAVEAFRRALDAVGVRDRSRTHRAQVAALRARPPVPANLR